MDLKIKKLHKDVHLPVYATEGAACFDIEAYCPDYDIEISNGDTVVIPTGLSFEIPTGHVMLVYSRSGHGFNYDVRLSNCVGVIDSDYRGEVLVKLYADFNSDGNVLKIKNGDRIAQAMIMKVPKITIVEVKETSSTKRGKGGFGSTGK